MLSEWRALAMFAFGLLLQFSKGRSDEFNTDFTDGKPGVWRNLAGDDYAWTPARYHEHGPTKDHTTGRGAYIYIISKGRSGRGWLFGDKWIHPKPIPRCLEFWFAMFGTTRGELTMTIKPSKKEYYPILFVNSTDIGDFRNRWFRLDVEIPESNRKETAAFKGNFREGDGESGIALDDIKILDGVCDCHDSLPGLCPFWEKKGSCKTNYRWMSKYCRKSCNTCSCRDYNPRCTQWALDGRCEDPDVEFNCPFNCAVCHCRDNFKVCSTLRNLGYCWKDETFMRQYCIKTCGWCPADYYDGSSEKRKLARKKVSKTKMKKHVLNQNKI